MDRFLYQIIKCISLFFLSYLEVKQFNVDILIKYRFKMVTELMKHPVHVTPQTLNKINNSKIL